MLDIHSHWSTYARSVVFLKPDRLPTPPDVIRQIRKDGIEAGFNKVFFEVQPALFAANLAKNYHRRQSNLLHQTAGRVRVQRHYLPLKRHSPVHR